MRKNDEACTLVECKKAPLLSLYIYYHGGKKIKGMFRTASLCYGVFVLSWGFNE
jgi:hypothetical protein